MCRAVRKSSQYKKKIKNALDDLNNKIEVKYSKLKEEEIKLLVIENKWMNKLSIGMSIELDHVSQNLTSRILELAERYENPLPRIKKEVDDLSIKVEEHLKKMGVVLK